MAGNLGKLIHAGSALSGCYSNDCGIICHDKVMHWLVLAGYVGKKQWSRASMKMPPNREYAFRDMLAAPTDATVTRAAADQVPAGHVIGFYQGQTLQHSMLSLGNGKYAGYNNLGVCPSIYMGFVMHNQFAWNANDTIGPHAYTMHHVDPGTVGQRTEGKMYGMVYTVPA